MTYLSVIACQVAFNWELNGRAKYSVCYLQSILSQRAYIDVSRLADCIAIVLEQQPPFAIVISEH